MTETLPLDIHNESHVLFKVQNCLLYKETIVFNVPNEPSDTEPNAKVSI